MSIGIPPPNSRVKLPRKRLQQPGDSLWPFWDGDSWPLQRLSDLQLRDKKVTNWITWNSFSRWVLWSFESFTGAFSTSQWHSNGAVAKPLRSAHAALELRQTPPKTPQLSPWRATRQVGGGCLHHQKIDEQKIDPMAGTLVTPFISGTLQINAPPPLSRKIRGEARLELKLLFLGGVGTFYLHLAAQNPWQNRNVGRLTGDFCQLENDWVLQGCKVLWQKQCQESKKKWLKVMLGVLDRLLRLIDRNLEP